MGTGTAAPKRNNGSRQFKFLLFIWLVMFGLGMFAGVTLTKKAFKLPLGIKLLGLSPIIEDIKAQVPPAPAVPVRQPVETPKPTTPNEAPNQPTEMSGITTPKEEKPVINSQPPVQQPDNTASETPAPSGMDKGELERKVRDYNDLLNRVRAAEKSYKSARKAAADSHTSKENLQAALDQQNTDMEEIGGALRQAQSIYDELKQDSQFEAKYTEDALALTIYPVPQAIKDLDADKLRFLKERKVK